MSPVPKSSHRTDMDSGTRRRPFCQRKNTSLDGSRYVFQILPRGLGKDWERKNRPAGEIRDRTVRTVVGQLAEHLPVVYGRIVDRGLHTVPVLQLTDQVFAAELPPGRVYSHSIQMA